MDKLEILNKITANKAEVKRLQEETKDLQKHAIYNGWAMWTFSKNSDLALELGVIGSEKAPSKVWWETHRKQSFTRLCTVSADPNHNDHKAFWSKPTTYFRPDYSI